MFFEAWSKLSVEKKKFTILVVVVLIFIYTVFIYISASVLFNNKMSATENHLIRMSSAAVEQGHTPPESLLATGNFSTVKVGSYIDSINNLSISDSSWVASFYMWFTWTGSKTLDPGGKMIIVDGTINKKELLEEFDGENNIHYQKYRVSAKLLKFFDTSRVPMETHMLNIYVEDGARDGSKLRYIADKDSNISSRVSIPGYKITGNSNVVKSHTYRSSYGDPRLSGSDKKTFTQYIIAVDIARKNMGVYGKIFLAMFAALALTLSSFFVKASDVGPRFALPTAAYFGAVTNSYIANSILPPSGSFGLVDYVTAFGLITIFMSIALALLSNYISVKKDDKEFSFILDRFMFFALTICCLSANIIIPWSATG